MARFPFALTTKSIGHQAVEEKNIKTGAADTRVIGDLSVTEGKLSTPVQTKLNTNVGFAQLCCRAARQTEGGLVHISAKEYLVITGTWKLKGVIPSRKFMRISTFGDRYPLESVYNVGVYQPCLLYTSPSPRDRQKSRMPSSA